MAALAVVLTSGMARAASFNFAFSNDPSLGNVAGTVTGELIGLPFNGTGAATSVLIDSYPAGLVQFGSYPTPFDVLAWSGGFFNENSFTVANGVIVSGAFSLSNANADQLFINSACCGGAGTNFLDIGSGDDLYVWNDNGMGREGVTFTSAGSGIPEPGTMVLLGAGLVCLSVRRVWKKRHA